MQIQNVMAHSHPSGGIHWTKQPTHSLTLPQAATC